MKIVTKIGNLMDVTAGHIVHGCNARGVMGAGVALAVKRKYPSAHDDYVRIYKDHGLVLGVAYPYAVSTNLVIWNAITQEGFGQPTRNCSYDAIQTCFEQINETLIQTGPSDHCELHIPFIGAGLGGGSWNIIKSIIEDTCTVQITVWSIDGKMPNGSLVNSIE